VATVCQRTYHGCHNSRKYSLLEKGNSHATLQSLINKTGAKAVFWNRMYEPAIIKRDSNIKKLLQVAGIDCRSFNGQLLTEPHSILNKAGSAFKVFSAYWKKTSREINPSEEIIPAPTAIHSPSIAEHSASLKQLNL